MSKTKSPKINLRSIREESKSFSWSEKDEWVEEMANEIFSQYGGQGGRVSCQAELRRSGKNTIFQGTVDLKLKPPCDRCGQEFSYPLHHEFEIVLIPQDLLTSADPLVFPTEESDNWGGSPNSSLITDDIASSIVADEKVDLSRYFKEQVYLSLPMTLVCQEKCPGLCPHCGAQLVRNSCNCGQTQHSESRPEVWGPLAQWKSKT
jgi:uncharacterized protein